jgi:excisionase family DNA binding protein
VGTQALGPFLTVTETARRLGVSRGTVHAMIHRGQLTRQTVGLREYVPAGQVNALLTTRITTIVSAATVSAWIEALKRHPELAAQLHHALADKGGDR